MSARLVSMFEADDYHAPLREAAEMMRDGKIVVLPTETVYGATGLLTNSSAVGRLNAIRDTDQDKPFTIHLAKREDAGNYLADVGELGRRMMTKLWPGPVAI